jgi:uncharacterized protein YjiS (DUF1127 family)
MAALIALLRCSKSGGEQVAAIASAVSTGPRGAGRRVGKVTEPSGLGAANGFAGADPVGDCEMMNLFRTVRLGLAQYRAYQAALAELGAYADRELAEIGIARGDVPRLAHLEAERRVAALAEGDARPSAATAPAGAPAAAAARA